MLYMTAFSPPPSVFEILITVRSSLPDCNVPCQEPVISWASNAPPGKAARAIIPSINVFMGDLLKRRVYCIL
jgi:hypothetical protein